MLHFVQILHVEERSSYDLLIFCNPSAYDLFILLVLPTPRQQLYEFILFFLVTFAIYQLCKMLYCVYTAHKTVC